MSTHLSQITVGIGPLTIEEVVAVARYGATVDIDPDALAAVENTRQRIEDLASNPVPVYGVSTGFGALARRYVPEELRRQL